MIDYTHHAPPEPFTLEPAKNRKWNMEERLLIRTAKDLLSANLDGEMSWAFLYGWLDRIEGSFPELSTNIRDYWSKF